MMRALIIRACCALLGVGLLLGGPAYGQDVAARGLALQAANKSPLVFPAARRSSIADQRAADTRDRSAAQAAAAYADSAASATLENWTNLTNWTGGTGVAQVSIGALYNNGGTASTAGINRAWTLGTTGKGRAVFLVSLVNSGSGRVLIGVSSDAAGAAPAANNANVKGLSFGPGSAAISNLGTDTSVLTTNQIAPITATYVVTVTVDENCVSVVATRAGTVVANSTGQGVDEYRARFLRAGFSINNLYIQNTSSLNLTGSSVGAVGWRNAIATLPLSFGIEGVGHSIFLTQRAVQQHNSNSTTQATIKIETPVGYDSRVPYPTIVYFHGNGSDENVFSDNSGHSGSLIELLNDGFIVISASSSNLYTWGSQSSLDAYAAAWKVARDNFNVGPVGFFANSMGGIESLLSLADGRIPAKAWAGKSATYSLADNYNNPLFTSVITSAYGIGTGGNLRPYSIATNGYDPALMPGDAFRGLPMLDLYAIDDAAVVQPNNSAALARIVAPFAPELIVPSGITGGHNYPDATIQNVLSSNSAGGGPAAGGNILGLQGTQITPAQVLGAFFKKYLQP